MDPVNVSAKFEVCSFTCSWDIALEFWVGVANPNLREEKAVGGRDGTIQNSVGEFL